MLGSHGCSSEHPTLTRLAADATILAFGDSLTKGTGGGDASYPAELARLTGRTVVNAGIPGELSTDGLQRLPQVLESTQPQLMILCHGGNDLLRRKDIKLAAANLRSMISLAHSRNVDVLLVGVPKPGLLLGTADFYPQVAAATGVPVETDILADILSNPSYKSDPIHPNARGYLRMAEAIYVLMKNAGAL